MGLKNNDSSEAAYDKAIRRMDEREANILSNSIVQMAQSDQIAHADRVAQSIQPAIQNASAVDQIMAQQESFMQAVKPIQDAVKPMQDLTQSLKENLKIQNTLQPYKGVMGQNTLNLTGAATAFSQLSQVSSTTQALTSAANTLAPATNALAQAVPLSSMTKSSDIVVTAMKPFQDVNPVYSGFLAAFESAALTPELQWLNKQLTIDKQTMDSGSLES